VRIYISGIISLGGTLPAEEIAQNIERFTEAEGIVRRMGHEPVNPVTLHESNEEPSTTAALWVMYSRQDIKVLVDCDGIYMMQGWARSRGARLEHHIAFELGLAVLLAE
jgi:hypothetical protein